MKRAYAELASVAAVGLMMTAGCATQPETAQNTGTAAPPPAVSTQASRRPMATGGSGNLSRQEAFLARIRQSSAGTGVIRDARMRGDNELGVVMGQGVKLSEVRPILVKLLKEMREEFPGRALTVRAYAPNNQPMAAMRYDPSAPASSNVTYTTNF